MSNPRAFVFELLPFLRAVEDMGPEGECPTLNRSDLVNAAALGCQKYAVPVSKLHEADPPHHFPAVAAQEFMPGDIQMIGDPTDLIWFHPDESGSTAAAGSAAVAFKPQAFVVPRCAVICHRPCPFSDRLMCSGTGRDSLIVRRICRYKQKTDLHAPSGIIRADRLCW